MRSRLQPEIPGQTDMQYSSIELKSSKYTLTIVMDPAASFEQILADITQKFTSSARFFKGAQMALEFRGKTLTPRQQSEAAAAVTGSCGMEIVCILERDEEAQEAQYKVITQVLKDRPAPADAADESRDGAVNEEEPFKGLAGSADVYRGTVKNGRKVLSDRSVLILGDVEPLGEVCCSGSIFVAGYAMGILRAGLGGDPHSFAAALVLKPQSLEVCGHKGVSGIRKKTMDDSYSIYPQAATVEDGHLKLSTISGKMWNRFFEKPGTGRTDDQM